MSGAADAVVVGSALVDFIKDASGEDGTIDAQGIDSVLDFVRDLASGTR